MDKAELIALFADVVTRFAPQRSSTGEKVPATLTRSEVASLYCKVVKHMTNAQVAIELVMSEASVNVYMSRCRKKLDHSIKGDMVTTLLAAYWREVGRREGVAESLHETDEALRGSCLAVPMDTMDGASDESRESSEGYGRVISRLAAEQV